MTPDGRRRNLWFPDDLWTAVVKAAAHETLETGDQVSVADYIRRAVSDKLNQASSG